MFQKIFIEENLVSCKRTKRITKFFPLTEKIILKDYREVFEKVKKPYLQKRENLNLFIAQKKGKLVKPTPQAYGIENDGESHYYYIQGFNCIYECEYCYLQGYFNSPDIVLFLNFEDISQKMEKILEKDDSKRVWFHSGEFTDSLALTHLTGEIEFFYEFFKNHKRAFWEIRTKSVNIKELLKLPALENIIVSFSLSPKNSLKTYDHKTATLSQRLKAIETLYKKGFSIGVHFDPIVPQEDLLSRYRELFLELKKYIPLHKLSYTSLGVVRYSEKSFLEARRNYPDSSLLDFQMTKGFDKKIRLLRPLRHKILKEVREEFLNQGGLEKRSYFCMDSIY